MHAFPKFEHLFFLYYFNNMTAIELAIAALSLSNTPNIAIVSKQFNINYSMLLQQYYSVTYLIANTRAKENLLILA